jgi:hypothetical protein
MTTDAEGFLDEWHRIVAEADKEALFGVLDPEVSMGAPPYWSPLEGRDIVHHLLGLVIDTIDEFTYHREWQSGGELALEFMGRVGDIELQGIDLISLNAANQIQRIDVLMRPYNGIGKLREVIAPQMANFLAGRSG